MNKSLLFFCFLGILFFISPKLKAKAVERISEAELDLSKPFTLYMTPGRSTLVDFPCDISHSILGLTGDIKVTIGPDSLQTMSLWLSNEGSQPTNLTVKCEDRVFVFDIFPNRHNHQDYVNIIDYFDGRTSAYRKLVDSSEKSSSSEKKHKKLINSSEIKNNKPSQLSWNQKILKKLNNKEKLRKLVKQGEK